MDCMMARGERMLEHVKVGRWLGWGFRRTAHDGWHLDECDAKRGNQPLVARVTDGCQHLRNLSITGSNGLSESQTGSVIDC
jgi:hypothetical protein